MYVSKIYALFFNSLLVEKTTLIDLHAIVLCPMIYAELVNLVKKVHRLVSFGFMFACIPLISTKNQTLKTTSTRIAAQK